MPNMAFEYLKPNGDFMSSKITQDQLHELGMNDELALVLSSALGELEAEFNSQNEAMREQCDDLQNEVDHLKKQLEDIQGKIDGGSY